MRYITFFSSENRISSQKEELQRKKEERLKRTEELLKGILSLKLYCWEKFFFGKVNEIRVKEIQALRKTLCAEVIGYFFFLPFDGRFCTRLRIAVHPDLKLRRSQPWASFILFLKAGILVSSNGTVSLRLGLS